MLSHKTELILEAVLGFFAFGFIASSGYLVNDVLDLNEDRKHQTKRKRPFASGELPVWVGLLTIPILWTLAALICAVLPPGLAAILVLYLLGTVSYSIWLKRFVLVDVMMLASLYTVRIVAGGAATNIVISPWTLTVSVFLFLSLALVKRVSELRRHHEAGSSIPGRDYGMLDAQHLGSMGIAAGYLSVLVTALYITSEDVALLYKRPQALWLILPVQLYWVSRVWLLANRGEVDDDPIIFAAKDKATYFASMLILTIVAFAVKSW